MPVVRRESDEVEEHRYTVRARHRHRALGLYLTLLDHDMKHQEAADVVCLLHGHEQRMGRCDRCGKLLS